MLTLPAWTDPNHAACLLCLCLQGKVGEEWCYTDAADRGWSKCAAASNMQALRDSVEGAMRVCTTIRPKHLTSRRASQPRDDPGAPDAHTRLTARRK